MTREEACEKAQIIDFQGGYTIALVVEIYNDLEAREMLLATKDVYCDDCKHYLSDNGNFPLEPCGECSRFYADKFERKDDARARPHTISH